MENITEVSDGAMSLSTFRTWASIGNTKVYAEIAAGRLRLTKVGGKSLILKSEARRWLASYASKVNSEAA